MSQFFLSLFTGSNTMEMQQMGQNPKNESSGVSVFVSSIFVN